MIKKIKFNIVIDGQRCRTIEDLQENFNLADIFDEFKSGKLEKWLRRRNFSELDAVLSIDKESEDTSVLRELCTIFDIEVSDEFISDELMYLSYQNLSNQNKKNKGLVRNIFDDFKIKENIEIKEEHKKELLKTEENKQTQSQLEILPGERFIVDSTFGVALDTTTNLIWLRFSLGEVWENGSRIQDVLIFHYEDALSAVDMFNEGIGYGGFKDWRIPTEFEMSTIDSSRKYIDDNLYINIFGVSDEIYMSTRDEATYKYKSLGYHALRLVRGKPIDKEWKL